MKRDARISSIYFFSPVIKQTSSMPRAAAGRQRLFEPLSPEMLEPRGKCPSLCCSWLLGHPRVPIPPSTKAQSPSQPMGISGSKTLRPTDGQTAVTNRRTNRCPSSTTVDAACAASAPDLRQQVSTKTGAIDRPSPADQHENRSHRSTPLGTARGLGGSLSPAHLLPSLPHPQGQGQRPSQRRCSGQCQRLLSSATHVALHKKKGGKSELRAPTGTETRGVTWGGHVHVLQLGPNPTY